MGLPELKKFLKEGEAESYQNVEVKYIHGRKAVLIIYDDEDEIERTLLSELETREEMHALMKEKGFKLQFFLKLKKLKMKLRKMMMMTRRRRRTMMKRKMTRTTMKKMTTMRKLLVMNFNNKVVLELYCLKSFFFRI